MVKGLGLRVKGLGFRGHLVVSQNRGGPRPQIQASWLAVSGTPRRAPLISGNLHLGRDI